MTTSISKVFTDKPKTAYRELEKFVGKYCALTTPKQIERLSKLNDTNKDLINDCRDVHHYITRAITEYERGKNAEDLNKEIAELPTFKTRTFQDLTAVMDHVEKGTKLAAALNPAAKAADATPPVK